MYDNQQFALNIINVFVNFAAEHKSAVLRVNTATKNVMISIEYHNLKVDNLFLLGDMLKVSDEVGGNIDIRHFHAVGSLESVIWYDLNRFLREVSREQGIRLIQEHYPELLELQEVAA